MSSNPSNCPTTHIAQSSSWSSNTSLSGRRRRELSFYANDTTECINRVCESIIQCRFIVGLTNLFLNNYTMNDYLTRDKSANITHS